MFNQLDDAISWIEKQIKFRPKTSLDHMKDALSILHLDLSKIKKIHVTGTNGKGSVCMMTTSILVKSGKNVGTFISPYLENFNERIKYNGQDISNEDLLKIINEIYQLNKNYSQISGQTLSFFELMTLMAIKFFHDKKVDVMIMEVGIGGLLDSTNILNYDVSVITNIGMDHMKQLGDTEEQIALNKLGILKKNGVLYTTVDSKFEKLFTDYATNKNAIVNFIDKNNIKVISEFPHIIEYKYETYKLSLLGDFQNLNACLAIEIVKHLYKDIEVSKIKQGLIDTKHSGRLEMVLDGVFIDGAHNVHAIKRVIYSLQSINKVYNINVLFSALSDKEPEKMLNLIQPFVKSITLTAFPDPRYKTLENLPFKFENNPKIALENLIQNRRENDVILITGSLHFIGYVKKEVIPYFK
ncbi:bifunctional folylpolyglutamate synthase/dihydrofolate synthase [Acholeplasma granularum]|uniref:bifunctional folylpolyglutamate synthase/dihydrofolate synthase n=1 Tax=Acholeplasma granularum TaxID=264635 RepID=UPI00046E5ED4|nr:Mur ligase family protein [Acholeplasma granularum]